MNYSFEIVDFDSNLFGFKVAQITNIEPGHVDELVSQLKQESIEYATYRLPSDKFSLIHEMEKERFVLIDGVIDFSISLKEATLAPVDSFIRDAKTEDIENLKKIAGDAFTLNRFYWDPVIPRQKAPVIYQQWIENSVAGKAADCVLLVTVNDKVVGFITLQKTVHSTGGQGHIPLLAVSLDFQGKGISRELLNGAFAKFKNWQVEQVTIATTMLNVAALRVYNSAGFKIIGSRLTFRWASESK